jgi:hypothetical protein
MQVACGQAADELCHLIPQIPQAKRLKCRHGDEVAAIWSGAQTQLIESGGRSDVKHLEGDDHDGRTCCCTGES